MGLKVANITEEGRFGGLQARILSVSEKLSAHGVETTVISPDGAAGPFYDKLGRVGVKRRRLPLRRLTRAKADLIRYVVFFVPEVVILRRFLAAGRFDVVHCNGAWQIKGPVAGKLAGVRVIWHLNDTRRSRLIQWFFRLVGSRFCDGFIFAGEKAKMHYRPAPAASRKPCMVIQAPVDTIRFSPDPEPLDDPAPESRGLMIVTVANINPAKGLEYFIEMAGRLNRSFLDLRFFIIGRLFENQKTYFDRLTRLTRARQVDNLFFIQDVDDVRPFLEQADIYVCSSIHEASPMSVWEAMAMAKPIVASDVGDVARFIKDGENGFIARPGDSAALARKVALLVKDEGVRKMFAAGARRIAIENLDIEICVAKHVRAYRAVLDP